MATAKATVAPHDVHKYERVKLGKKKFEVYKCVLPNCPHWIRKEFVEGKLTKCWRCENTVIMTKPMARMKKPHCVGCTRDYIRVAQPEPDQQPLQPEGRVDSFFLGDGE